MKQNTMQSKIKGTVNSASTLRSLFSDLNNFRNGKTGGDRIQAIASSVAKIIGAGK